MSNDKLTDQEKLNLEKLKEWEHCWTTRGLAAKLVDEIYADSPEVFTPIQNTYYAKKGKSKENWRNVELEAEKLYQKREMKIVNKVVSGNTIAMEILATTTSHKGNAHEEWFGVFLTFDENGRIISDHSYMLVNIPGKGFFPPGLKEAMDKIAQDQ